jgi:hypothetical protein
MGAELINGQHLADSFLAFGPAQSQSSSRHLVGSGRTGPVSTVDVPFQLQFDLAELYAPAPALLALQDSRYRKLFQGDWSEYPSQSEADLAFAGFLAGKELTEDQADLVFRSAGLYREKWDEQRGNSTYGEMTIAKAYSDLPQKADNTSSKPSLNLASSRPQYIAGGMPARHFVGPAIADGIRLFPAKALSAFVALGGSGKTTLLITIAVHVAAGKPWNGHRNQQAKVAIFCVEETQEELNRKFSAIVDSWSTAEREAAIHNLLLVSLLGKDARLTVIDRSQYQATVAPDAIIQVLNEFGLKDGLVILDHMQGFASGDLNISETATSICREANKIVDATGAAVVFAAHISKANIGAEEIEQGFAVGSLAFENAVRQMSGMIGMSDVQAKKYGPEVTRKEYVWLGVAKNSYGNTADGMWLRKVYSEKYHTVVMEPADLTVPMTASKKSANDKLGELLIDYLTRHPWTTKNALDGVAGLDGQLKAAKSKVRDVLRALLDTGEVELCPVSVDEREASGLGKQVKDVLRVKPAKPSPPTGGHDLNRRA